MVQCMGRSKRSESKGRLLTGWWKGTFGLIALLGLLMGVMVAQVKPPERERLLERRDGREGLFERMHGGRSPNTLFRFPTSSFTSRSRQFSEELVWFKPLLDPSEVVFSPDGQFLASPKRGGGIGIFRVSDGTLVRTLTGHTDSVYSVTFSPNGNLIASGSLDSTIKIWRVTDGTLVRTLTGHTGEVLSVTFSPNGSLIASGGGDGLALWRVGAPTNRPPSIPTLLSPDDGSTVSPTPTFKVKSEDPDGDDVKFVLELRKGDEVKNFETGFFASGSEATFTVPSDQALSEGQWSWRARAIDSKGAVSDWSGTRTIQVILVPLIKSGVRLVSCPVIGPTDPKSVFAFDDDKWAWFDPTSGYLLYPNSQTNLQVGKGYWAKFV